MPISDLGREPVNVAADDRGLFPQLGSVIGKGQAIAVGQQEIGNYQ
jgi:hypothetical protein